MQSFKSNGDLLLPYQLREMCKKVKMSHEVLRESQVLRLDVSKLGLDADLFFNHLVSNVPSGNGLMQLKSSGSIHCEMDNKLIKTITAIGPVDTLRPLPIIGGVVAMVPSTKPGWLISLFKTRSCVFA